MADEYKGHYTYSKKVIGEWNSDDIGVYYCGFKLDNGNLKPLYIGKGIGDGGIRSRLLDHLSEDHWPDVTHFGYRVCDNATEAENFEAEEIDRCKPKYNDVQPRI
ncbi:hypothetical protein KJ885_02190 [Patescibacteria group bacterium]|nr:hypothetical protein [Patescibacteria group bacterium]